MEVSHPVCPCCGNYAYATDTRYGVRHDHCGLWSWGGAPLVDEYTHEARRAAHAAFDTLWKLHGFTRGEAYKHLASEMGLTRDQCHMKVMDEFTARRVPAAVQRIIDREDDEIVIEP